VSIRAAGELINADRADKSRGRMRDGAVGAAISHARAIDLRRT
jgi:hypothetical protein